VPSIGSSAHQRRAEPPGSSHRSSAATTSARLAPGPAGLHAGQDCIGQRTHVHERSESSSPISRPRAASRQGQSHERLRGEVRHRDGRVVRLRGGLQRAELGSDGTRDERGLGDGLKREASLDLSPMDVLRSSVATAAPCCPGGATDSGARAWHWADGAVSGRDRAPPARCGGLSCRLMTSTGAFAPVHSSNAAALWSMSIRSPFMTRIAPAACASLRSFVSSGTQCRSRRVSGGSSSAASGDSPGSRPRPGVDEDVRLGQLGLDDRLVPGLGRGPCARSSEQSASPAARPGGDAD
jgi:hypothetical protein